MFGTVVIRNVRSARSDARHGAFLEANCSRIFSRRCIPLSTVRNCHMMKAMPMTSLNISLPEALKEYVEGQVATGDWGTPSEYIRELIRQDKERRLGNLEQELAAAAKGPKIEIPLAEIRRKGLVTALRDRTRRR